VGLIGGSIPGKGARKALLFSCENTAPQWEKDEENIEAERTDKKVSKRVLHFS